MAVKLRWYSAVHENGYQSFLTDINEAHRTADAAGDADGRSALLRLWLEHFNAFLGGHSVADLVEYLETRQLWRKHKEWLVFKTVDQPCISYTAQKDASDVTLIALGACYRLPNDSEQAWWDMVILPRVRRL